jgi:exodeoxyribonuclease V alpha subunit
MNNETLSGTIESFLYQNEETGFSIFKMSLPHQKKATVTGSFHNIHSGESITLEGEWIFHPKFGKQFKAAKYIVELPTSINGLKKYLGSGLIKGIGKTYAEKIVDAFKEDTLKIIEEQPDRLGLIDGIGKKRLEQIKKSWVEQKFIARIMVFLQGKGISTNYAIKIYKKYGHESIAIITENPYRLTEDIWGIGFKIADEIAQNIGFATGSIERVAAGILFTLKEATGQGHVYQELVKLRQQAFNILDLDPELHQQEMKTAFRHLYNKDKIKVIPYEKTHFVGLSSLYGSEKGLSEKIKKLSSIKSKHSFDTSKLYKEMNENPEITLNEKQQDGILSCFLNKISIITGGPGTGKTTIIKTLLGLLDTNHMRYKLAAPTGRAAKRMMETSKRHTSTIHRLLEFDASIMQFSKNEQNAIEADFIIIDEASMIDVFLARSIFKAVPEDAHIVFIGDIDQLPSVGPGNVLLDMIKTDSIATTKLTEIFRQSQDSLIVHNAHKINNSQFPSNFEEGCKKDFYFIKEENPENAFNQIKMIIKEKFPQHHISVDKSIVLVPMNRGSIGTQSLNHQLQEFLNPYSGNETYSVQGMTYKKNDKVMQIKNNYDKKVFNGDIGFIQQIDVENKMMMVSFYNKVISYNFADLYELVLAYSITIHKSQGSEYDAVIIPLFTQHFTMLQKNLIYTAITRAKKVCFFVGQTKAIAIGIKNVKQRERISFLHRFLTEEISCM